VSFTLTPMMSARMLRPDAGGTGHGADSRRGFYRHIERSYLRLLEWSIHHRAVVAAAVVLIALSAIPLYGVVRQEYIPSDVDEAEFEMRLTAPQGTSLEAMGEAIRAVEQDVRTLPGVRLALSSVGGMFLGAVNEGELYIRIAPHEERVLSLPRIAGAAARLRPLEAFRNNYSQRDVMAAVRERMKRFPDLDVSIRNLPSFSIGGPSWDVNFVLRGPDLVELSRLAEALRSKADDLGLVDAATTLDLNKPAPGAHRPRPRRGSAGGQRTGGRRAPTDGRR